MSLLGYLGETVAVLRPSDGRPDAFGAPTRAWGREEVAGVLVDAPTTSDLGEGRPDGDRAGLTLHFPSSYAASLRGCRVECRGATWEVEGDPQPYEAALVPGPWDRAARVRRVDG